MTLSRNPKLSLATAGLFIGLAGAGLQACDDPPPGVDLLEACGFGCPDARLMEGNANISGVASVDAFFGAVLSVKEASAKVRASVRAELEGIAASLEVDIAGLDAGAAADLVKTALEAKIEANIDGDLTITYTPVVCQASVDVAFDAAIECDASVDPLEVQAHCDGTCEVSASVAAMCEAEGTLRCEGQAPNFECVGSCTGTCQLQVAAACSGTCNGSCTGACTACVGGSCEGDGAEGVTNCAGSCDGDCSGSCELEAGGECSGKCEGSCAYTPPNGGCEANATAKCDVSGMSEAQCSGSCEGSVEPPAVSAECKASVEAKTKADVQCTPPALSIEFKFDAEISAQAQAEFRVWLKGFSGRFSNMLAGFAKIEHLFAAAIDIGLAAEGTVTGAVQTYAEGEIDLQVAVGLACAMTELGVVIEVADGVRADLDASSSALLVVGGVVGMTAP